MASFKELLLRSCSILISRGAITGIIFCHQTGGLLRKGGRRGGGGGYNWDFTVYRNVKKNTMFPRLKPIDITFMKMLHTKVNIVPVIAKADCLTKFEMSRLKRKVSREKFNII